MGGLLSFLLLEPACITPSLLSISFVQFLIYFPKLAICSIAPPVTTTAVVVEIFRTPNGDSANTTHPTQRGDIDTTNQVAVIVAPRPRPKVSYRGFCRSSAGLEVGPSQLSKCAYQVHGSVLSAWHSSFVGCRDIDRPHTS